MLSTEYNASYAQIAFDCLARNPLIKEESLCLVFKCSVPTLAKWKADHDEFSNAIELGVLAGETKTREAMAKLSLMPSKRINTKLLSILASNVHGITEEQVNRIHATVGDSELTAEERLKKRGIPVPDIEIDDIVE